MEKILTISIAAYNMEKYIEETLTSLIDENYIDKLEIFVVDDGGTDKTLEIVRPYAQKYPNSIIPIHKKNGGYGSVINTCIRLATGKYFKQLDGDDWFVKDNLKDFIEILSKTNADYVITPAIKYYEKTREEIIQDCCRNIKEGLYTFNELCFQEALSMYCSTFRTTLLQKKSLRVTENCLYTDTEFICLPIPYIDSIYVLPLPIYVYRIGRTGQSMSFEGIKKHYKEHEIVLWNIAKIYHDIDLKSMSKKMLIKERLIIEIINQFLFMHYFKCTKEKFKELKEFCEKLKRNYPNVLDDAIKQSRFVKAFVYSNGLLYPLLCARVKYKFKKSGGSL